MKKIYILAALTLVLTACDNNNNNPDGVVVDPDAPQTVMEVSATIGERSLSRASDVTWGEGDRIGISSTVGDVVGPFINLEYTTADGDGKFEGTDIFFYNNMTLTAYYPFAGKEGTAPGTIEATTGADFQTVENQPKIDFLWDTKTGVGKQDFSAGEPNVNFTFAHKMSKISFKFKGSQPVYDPSDPTVMLSRGVDVATMIEYSIKGMVLDGTFDTATGTCAIDGDTATLIQKFDPLNVTDEDFERVREFPSLIVFPQPADGFTLHITTDELKHETALQHYKCALAFTDNVIKPGCHYNFTIQVTKRGLSVGNLEITPWSDADEKFVTATIDGGVDDNEEGENE